MVNPENKLRILGNLTKRPSNNNSRSLLPPFLTIIS